MLGIDSATNIFTFKVIYGFLKKLPICCKAGIILLDMKVGTSRKPLIRAHQLTASTLAHIDHDINARTASRRLLYTPPPEGLLRADWRINFCIRLRKARHRRRR